MSRLSVELSLAKVGQLMDSIRSEETGGRAFGNPLAASGNLSLPEREVRGRKGASLV